MTPAREIAATIARSTATATTTHTRADNEPGGASRVPRPAARSIANAIQCVNSTKPTRTAANSAPPATNASARPAADRNAALLKPVRRPWGTASDAKIRTSAKRIGRRIESQIGSRKSTPSGCYRARSLAGKGRQATETHSWGTALPSGIPGRAIASRETRNVECGQPRRIQGSLEPAVPRICGVNSPHGIRRNQLDGDRACLHRAFVPEIVDVVAARIDKSHPDRVHLRPAAAIVSFIAGHRACGHDDQAMSRMRVPAGARRPAPRRCFARRRPTTLPFSATRARGRAGASTSRTPAERCD